MKQRQRSNLEVYIIEQLRAELQRRADERARQDEQKILGGDPEADPRQYRGIFNP